MPAARRARAERHQEQARAAASASLRMARVREQWEQADPADPADDVDAAGGMTDAQRDAAADDFKARRRAYKAAQRPQASPGATLGPEATAALTAALSGPQNPSETAGTAPVPGHDGGPSGKAESSVAAPAAESGSDLREWAIKSGAELGPDRSELGRRYEQRNNRLQTRMRQLDETRPVTALRSLRKCGAGALSGAVAITQKADGSGGFTGVFRCGSVWACPECAPIVRTDRARIMEQYALAWSTEHDAAACTGNPDDAGTTHQPHGMAHATLTSRHGKHARLEDTFKYDRHGQLILDADGQPEMRPGQLARTAAAWRKLLQSRWWRKVKAEYGVAGATRAIEVTHSWANGWHTHIHAVLWCEQPVTDEVAARLEGELYARWEAQCRKNGLGRPTRKHGVKVEPARRGAEGAADIAKYLVKVQDKDLEEATRKGDRPSPEQSRRLSDARIRRERAKARGDRRAEAEADSLISSIREEIGEAARARALGNELLRGDLKTGRQEGRTPFEILRKALAATVPERAALAAADRQARDGDDQAALAARAQAARLRAAIGRDGEMALWNEFERATKGHRMLTWSGPVRERLIRLTDAEERDGQDVVYDQDAVDTRAILVQVKPDPWRQVAARPGRRGQLRIAVKVASDHAVSHQLDMETAAREAVRELLESWGLEWGVDMYGPGAVRVEPDNGEILGIVPVVEPQHRPDRRAARWETPGELEAEGALLGMRPRDIARPEQAARRSRGLPIAREATAVLTEPKVPAGPCCTVCGDTVDARLSFRHIGC